MSRAKRSACRRRRPRRCVRRRRRGRPDCRTRRWRRCSRRWRDGPPKEAAQASSSTSRGMGAREIDPSLDLSRIIGWFTTHFPVAFDPDPGAAAGVQIAAVHDRLRAVPGRGLAATGCSAGLRGRAAAFGHDPRRPSTSSARSISAPVRRRGSSGFRWASSAIPRRRAAISSWSRPMSPTAGCRSICSMRGRLFPLTSRRRFATP